MISGKVLPLVTAALFSYFVVSVYFLYVSNSRSKRLAQQSRSQDVESLADTGAVVTNTDVFKLPASHGFNSTTVYDQQVQQKSRRGLIINGCRNQSMLGSHNGRRIKAAARTGFSLLVDDRLRYIYCRVAKAASTTWTRVLLVASGKIKAKDPNKLSQTDTYAYLRDGYPIRRLSSYTPEQIDDRLKNYFKFMFVRHPLDRLVSAYKDRLKSEHLVPRRRYERRIIKKYRRPGEVLTEKGVQFREFVRFLVDPATRKSRYNAHWRPQTTLCMPCLINYDFVGHYETLYSDAAAVLARINSSRIRKYPVSDPDNRRHRYNKTQRLMNMFSGVNQSDIDVLKNIIYRNDFLLFGYTFG